MHNSTTRFSDRVENYIKYRPSYPPAILDALKPDCGLHAGSVIADLGSGTGILSELFLRNGNLVYGVEPNKEMREAGERLLREHARFVSVDGTAEQTTLPDRCADFVTAGQAFHWFERIKARSEFERILKPDGWVVLIWNDRRTDSTPFLRAYEKLLLQFSTDYEKINHKQVDEKALHGFYGGDSFKLRCFDNQQVFDYEGLEGRLLSSSYAPAAGHPDHAPMIGRLAEIFEKYQKNGRVVFEYDTTLYYGRLVV